MTKVTWILTICEQEHHHTEGEGKQASSRLDWGLFTALCYGLSVFLKYQFIQAAYSLKAVTLQNPQLLQLFICLFLFLPFSPEIGILNPLALCLKCILSSTLVTFYLCGFKLANLFHCFVMQADYSPLRHFMYQTQNYTSKTHTHFAQGIRYKSMQRCFCSEFQSLTNLNLGENHNFGVIVCIWAEVYISGLTKYAIQNIPGLNICIHICIYTSI